MNNGRRLLSFAVNHAHQVTWCCIQKLCSNSGGRQYCPSLRMLHRACMQHQVIADAPIHIHGTRAPPASIQRHRVQRGQILALEAWGVVAEKSHPPTKMSIGKEPCLGEEGMLTLARARLPGVQLHGDVPAAQVPQVVRVRRAHPADGGRAQGRVPLCCVWGTAACSTKPSS
jgi:hypothetical protein